MYQISRLTCLNIEGVHMSDIPEITAKKILITDDNPVNIKTTTLILERAGYLTESAYNGKECIEKTKSVNPDLILLDISMPETSGLTVCKTLRKNNHAKNIPIIFVTAHTDNTTLKEAFDSGGTDYVRKPVNKIELLARIKSALIQQELIKKLILEEKLEGVLEMAGAVCHELNQPLQFISGSLELLLMSLPHEDPRYQDITKIKFQVEKMGKITKKLMGITTYETTKYVGNTRIIDIHGSSSISD